MAKEATEKTPVTPEEIEAMQKHSLKMKKSALAQDLLSCDMSDRKCRAKARGIQDIMDEIDASLEGFDQKRAMEIALQISSLFEQLSEGQRNYLQIVATDVRKKKQYSFFEAHAKDGIIRDSLIMSRYERTTGTKAATTV